MTSSADRSVIVRYARAGDGLHLAYAVLGEDGPMVVRLVGAMTHIQAAHEEAVMRRLDDRLAAFCRVVVVDERGSGMSDPVGLSESPTFEQRADDVLSVLDDVGEDRVTLFGMADGAPLAMVLAATHPGRVDRLILWGASARRARDIDYPFGLPSEVLERAAENIADGWGTGAFLDIMGPTEADGPFRERYARYERAAASPGQVLRLMRKGFASDVRHVLPSISVPTLVLHRREDRATPVEMGRYIAQQIAGAALVELEGSDSFPFLGDFHAVADEIEDFLIGERSGDSGDRSLATVLYTDIVGSTERAVTLGDRRWRDLIDEHDAMARRQLDRFRGREVKSMGDGFLATFDGPARAMRCAAALRDGAARLGLDIRAGLHAGEIELRGPDVGGIAVHIASRVLAKAAAGEVLVSSAVPPLVVGSGLSFVDRGEYDLKGVPGRWKLFAVDF
jgi:class 3 adenylate cyclase/pimeloyl-ACP methyl ester carboxylesterase